MKDSILQNHLKDKMYKDVVVIGNGPSGITLSYMLSGHWPYWIKDKVPKHPDELLRARLNYADNTQSLVLQDLEVLSDGLEGRSTNPVSLLFDSLQYPCVDMGLNLPSMLDYKHNPDKEIDHVVIGKGPAGGAWHRMDPNLRTLSVSAWMSLPGLDYNTWERSHPPKTETNTHTTTNNAIITQKESCAKCKELNAAHNQPSQTDFTNNNESETGALCCSCSKLMNKQKQYQHSLKVTSDDVADSLLTTSSIPPRRNLSLRRENSKEVQTRALVSRVAEYYESYVSEMGLDKHFQNNSIVTSVMPLLNNDEVECTNGKFKNARWTVCGFDRLTNKSFVYFCKNVVLANGSSDFANRLGIRGEGVATPWIKYELPHLESALVKLDDEQKSKLKPVVIVGAGLSAADAVTICRSSGINVIHVFRNRNFGLDKKLPENVYPEYHEVHKMMQNSMNPHDFYTPYPEHTISDISQIPTPTGGHLVTLKHLKTDETVEIEVSYCAILIGSRPDFRFISSLCSQKHEPATIDTDIIDSITESPCKWNRRISWLKTLCAKCKHINLCERPRRNDYKKICGHNINGKHFDPTMQQTLLCQAKNDVNTNKIEEISSGLGLGENPEKAVDCKTNPIAVNKFTNRVLNTPKGLYAMGPLISDNFIRFIPGGALAITSALHKEND